MDSNDLCPSDVKTFDGVWLEFANWWAMLKRVTTMSPEWRAILERLHEYHKNKLGTEDRVFLLGTSAAPPEPIAHPLDGEWRSALHLWKDEYGDTSLMRCIRGWEIPRVPPSGGTMAVQTRDKVKDVAYHLVPLP